MRNSNRSENCNLSNTYNGKIGIAFISLSYFFDLLNFIHINKPIKSIAAHIRTKILPITLPVIVFGSNNPSIKNPSKAHINKANDPFIIMLNFFIVLSRYLTWNKPRYYS